MVAQEEGWLCMNSRHPTAFMAAVVSKVLLAKDLIWTILSTWEAALTTS